MVEQHRDPEVVGYEWAAWYALQGDEPLSRVFDCAVDLERKLGMLSSRLHKSGDHEGSEIASSAHFFLIALAELLDKNGTSEFEIKKIERRKRGKPIAKHERALHGRKSASWVEQEIREGKQQEQAVLEAAQKFNLSRAEIFSWLSNGRAWSRRANSPNNQD